MTFNEANTVEAFIRDLLAGDIGPARVSPALARRGGRVSGLGWHYVRPGDLPRQPQEALVEPYLREALIRLNPDIAANPSRVDDVLYRLRAIVMGVRTDGLVKANEEFAAWAHGGALDAVRPERRACHRPPHRLSTTSSRTPTSSLNSSPSERARRRSVPIWF